MSINEFGEPSSGRSKRVAKPPAVELSPGGVPVTEANANQTLKFPEAQKGTIGRLVEVVELLQRIEQLNDAMQAQFATGSPSWNLCETIDDRLHDAFVLLGE